jgi:hypothetical protein
MAFGFGRNGSKLTARWADVWQESIARGRKSWPHVLSPEGRGAGAR